MTSFPVDKFVELYPTMVRQLAQFLSRLLSNTRESAIGANSDRIFTALGDALSVNLPYPHPTENFDWFIHNHPHNTKISSLLDRENIPASVRPSIYSTPSSGDLRAAATRGSLSLGIVDPQNRNITEYLSPDRWDFLFQGKWTEGADEYDKIRQTTFLRPAAIEGVLAKIYSRSAVPTIETRTKSIMDHSLLGQWLSLLDSGKVDRLGGIGRNLDLPLPPVMDKGKLFQTEKSKIQP